MNEDVNKDSLWSLTTNNQLTHELMGAFSKLLRKETVERTIKKMVLERFLPFLSPSFLPPSSYPSSSFPLPSPYSSSLSLHCAWDLNLKTFD